MSDHVSSHDSEHDDLRDQITEALKLAAVEGRLPASREPLPMASIADTVMAIVWPSFENLIDLLERIPETHMRFGVIGDPRPIAEMPCADWCTACQLDNARQRAEKAEAEIERLTAEVAEIGNAKAMLAETQAEIKQVTATLECTRKHQDSIEQRSTKAHADREKAEAKRDQALAAIDLARKIHANNPAGHDHMGEDLTCAMCAALNQPEQEG